MAQGPASGWLRWRCRRGMKELDVVLERWLEAGHPGADEAGRPALERLLDAPDPELAGWLLGRQRPGDPALRRLVDAILAVRS